MLSVTFNIETDLNVKHFIWKPIHKHIQHPVKHLRK